MQTTTLQIEGMGCDHCVKAVREALQGVDGVSVSEVAIGHATVQYDESRVKRDQLGAAVADAGYEVKG